VLGDRRLKEVVLNRRELHGAWDSFEDKIVSHGRELEVAVGFCRDS
jgi:hypothetical protein